jgi:hypothetical protein
MDFALRPVEGWAASVANSDFMDSFRLSISSGLSPSENKRTKPVILDKATHFFRFWRGCASHRITDGPTPRHPYETNLHYQSRRTSETSAARVLTSASKGQLEFASKPAANADSWPSGALSGRQSPLRRRLESAGWLTPWARR